MDPILVNDARRYFSPLQKEAKVCCYLSSSLNMWSNTTGGGSYYSYPAVGYKSSKWAQWTAMVTLFVLKPILEGLTIGVILLLSTVAVIVRMCNFRKRPKG